eukprot:4437754-Prorocentrum_lima.AAC.1
MPMLLPGKRVYLHRCQTTSISTPTSIAVALQDHALAGIYEQEAADSGHNEVLLDLACGIGGFLAAARTL